MMIKQHIKTVKKDIAQFKYKVSKAPNDWALIAKYAPLIHKHQQLLSFLERLPDTKKGNHNNNVLHTAKSKKTSTIRLSTMNRDNQILDIVKDYPQGVEVHTIAQQLAARHDIVLKESTLHNHVWKMHTERNLLDKVQMGVYKIKED